jgi:MFS family permease
VLATIQVILFVALTVIVVSLPDIQDDLGLGRSDVALVSSAFGLSFSGLLILGGRLADLFGRRRLLMLGLTVSAVASVAGGVAPGLAVLLLARFVQGIGAALAAPTALALVHGDVFADAGRQGRAVAAWGVLAPIGATTGLLVSGLVVTWSSWRWTFAIPTVGAGVAGLLVPRLVPAGPAPTRTRLDVPGALLVTAGLSALSFALVSSEDHPGCRRSCWFRSPAAFRW